MSDGRISHLAERVATGTASAEQAEELALYMYHETERRGGVPWQPRWCEADFEDMPEEDS